MEKIRDQITTSNIEYAEVLDRACRKGFMVPHNDGYMWRVVNADSRDFSRTEWIGPLANAPQGPINIPGPTVWLFDLEREGDASTAE
jgi:hypothetical protein